MPEHVSFTEPLWQEGTLSDRFVTAVALRLRYGMGKESPDVRAINHARWRQVDDASVVTSFPA